jgi:hypothetical protein
MGTLNAVKNRIRTLGLTSEDDEVKGDSPMAAAARTKGLNKYDMATGVYSGPGAAISNAIRAVRGDLGTEASARKEMGSKAAREADAEMKRETRGIEKSGTNSEDYMSPDTENKLKEEKRFNKMSAESPSQKYANGG